MTRNCIKRTSLPLIWRVVGSSETSVSVYKIIGIQVLEDCHLHIYSCTNIKYHNQVLAFTLYILTQYCLYDEEAHHEDVLADGDNPPHIHQSHSPQFPNNLLLTVIQQEELNT